MSEAPGWFADHLAVLPHEGATTVDGGRTVRWLRWGDPLSAPMLLLLHGGGAHARWWSPLAPFLSGDRQRAWCVVAPDLAGMGDSDWRPDGYRTEDWAVDALRVAADAAAVPGGVVAPAVVVGHSLGATVATVAGSLHPDAVRAVLLCDIGLPRPGRALAGGRAGRHFQNRITYPSAAEALSRFKLDAPPGVPERLVRGPHRPHVAAPGRRRRAGATHVPAGRRGGGVGVEVRLAGVRRHGGPPLRRAPGRPRGRARAGGVPLRRGQPGGARRPGGPGAGPASGRCPRCWCPMPATT